MGRGVGGKGRKQATSSLCFAAVSDGLSMVPLRHGGFPLPVHILGLLKKPAR